jgi:hypothetical protein
MLTRIFTAALLLAILTSTAPAHAAYVSAINADLDLHFASGDELTGNINLLLNPNPHAAAILGPWTGIGTSLDLSVNGTPLNVLPGIVASAGPVPGIVAILGSPFGPEFDFIVNTAFLPPNPTYSDFGLRPYYGPFSGDPTATGGTVTVLSETVAAPLPNALPLFGSGVMMLAGFAVRRRGKVSA